MVSEGEGSGSVSTLKKKRDDDYPYFKRYENPVTHIYSDIHSEEEFLFPKSPLSKERQEIYDKYHKEIRDSDGFDIVHYPGDYWPCMIRPYDIEPPEVMKAVTELATTGIQEYNKTHKTKYEVLEVEKAHKELYVLGYNYYITFKAKERKRPRGRGKTAVVKTFQAQVFDHANRKEHRVELVRLKKKCPHDDEKVASTSASDMQH